MIQTEEQVGDDVFLHTDWRAPDLDCVVLRSVEDRRESNGKITGHFEIQATKVTLGTPDPRLFELPDDYLERSPSQMHAELTQNRDMDPVAAYPVGTNERLAREDQRYFANHQSVGK